MGFTTLDPSISPYRTDQIRSFQQNVMPQAVKNNLLGENSVGTLNIQNASITNAKIVSFTFDKGQGGTLTLGGTSNGNGVLSIQDLSGNQIVRGDNTGNHYYNTSGNELIQVNDTGLIGYTTSAVKILHLKPTGLNVYGNSGDVVIINDSSGNSKGSLGYNGALAAGTVSLTSDNGSTGILYLYGKDNAKLIGGAIATVGVGVGAGYTGIDLTTTNDITLTCVNFKINGSTKTAIVPTSEGYKALYCAESPEVWFFDFADTKDTIDPLFLEVTEGPMKTLSCTDGSIQVWRRRKGYNNERFTAKTAEQFDKNNIFWNQAV